MVVWRTYSWISSTTNSLRSSLVCWKISSLQSQPVVSCKLSGCQTYLHVTVTGSLYLSTGYIHSRVEEEFLWDCKQLGAYSPIVLLNTLLFFCCKHFGFTTVKQHRQLSFARLMRCTKTNQNHTKTTFLCFYPPLTTKETEQGTSLADSQHKIFQYQLMIECYWVYHHLCGFIMFSLYSDVPSKRRKEEESKDKILEMMENTENPLRCPVRLFEFYLSKW